MTAPPGGAEGDYGREPGLRTGQCPQTAFCPRWPWPEGLWSRTGGGPHPSIVLPACLPASFRVGAAEHAGTGSWSEEHVTNTMPVPIT